MSALLYGLYGKVQKSPGGFGSEHPTIFKEAVKSLNAAHACTPGAHRPGVTCCSFCGYGLNIKQVWQASIGANDLGIQPGTVVEVGGDCLEHLLREVPVGPNWGPLSIGKARNLVRRRTEACEVIETYLRTMTQRATGYWAKRMAVHAKEYVDSVQSGDPLPELAIHLDHVSYDLVKCFGRQVRIPVPLGFAKYTPETEWAITQLTRHEDPEAVNQAHILKHLTNRSAKDLDATAMVLADSCTSHHLATYCRRSLK